MTDLEQIDCDIAVIMRQQASLRQKQLDVQRALWQICLPIEVSNANWQALRQMSADLDVHRKELTAARQTMTLSSFV